MERRGNRIAFLCAASCLAALLFGGIAFRESIRGAWLAAKLPSLSGEEGWDLARRLLDLGPGPRRAAERWYLDRLQRGDEKWKEAVEILGAHSSAECIPGLLEKLAGQDGMQGDNFVVNDPEAWFGLGGIHERHAEEATQELLRVLRAGKKEERWWAARFFAAIGPVGAAALPQLHEALRDPDPCLRVEAATALYEMGAKKETFLPVVISLLREKDEEVVERSLLVVIRMGREAASALSVILEILRERGFEETQLFEEAVAGMGGAAVPAFAAILTGTGVRVRSGAAVLLGRIGPAAEPAVGDLRRALGDSDEGVAEKAADALGKIGPKAVAAVQDLKAIVESGRDGPVRRRCIESLGLIGPEAKAACPAIIDILNRGEERSAPLCAMALVRIGIDDEVLRRAAEIVPSLEKILSGPLPPHSFSKVWASCALILLDPRRRSELQPAILRALEDDRYREDPNGAASALGYLGKGNASVVRALIGKALDYGQVRCHALRSLKRIGADVAGEFLVALDDGGRAAAAEALGVLSSGAPEVIAALLEALNDPEADVRIAAAESLGAFGPRAREAISLLEAARKGRHRGLRQAAAAALARIREGGEVFSAQRSR